MAANHIDDQRRLRRVTLRELEYDLMAAAAEAEFAQGAETMARRRPPVDDAALNAARDAARRRGAELVSEWVEVLDKSNSSGTPVRPRAQIRAGNGLIQEANRMCQDDPLKNAFKAHGNYLITKGKSGTHKSQREAEAMLAMTRAQPARLARAPRRPAIRGGGGGSGRRDPILSGLIAAQTSIVAASSTPDHATQRIGSAVRILSQLRVSGTGPWVQLVTRGLIWLQNAQARGANRGTVISSLDQARNSIAMAMIARRRQLGRA